MMESLRVRLNLYRTIFLIQYYLMHIIARVRIAYFATNYFLNFASYHKYPPVCFIFYFDVNFCDNLVIWKRVFEQL